VIAYGAGVESESFVVDVVVVVGGADAGGGGGVHSSAWGVGDGASPEGVEVRKVV